MAIRTTLKPPQVDHSTMGLPPGAKWVGIDPPRQPKKQLTLRLDVDIIAKFKATGPGWQARMNDALKEAKV